MDQVDRQGTHVIKLSVAGVLDRGQSPSRDGRRLSSPLLTLSHNPIPTHIRRDGYLVLHHRVRTVNYLWLFIFRHVFVPANGPRLPEATTTPHAHSAASDSQHHHRYIFAIDPAFLA